MGSRRKARECGLQVLYLLETQGKELPAPGRLPEPSAPSPLIKVSAGDIEQALADFFEHFDAPERIHEYAGQIVRGVVEHLDRIDGVIGKNSPRWRVERMALVDRSALRIGTWELLFATEVPARAILDEAVEIARRFGSESSSAFVNGVLDRVAKELRPDELNGRGA